MLAPVSQADKIIPFENGKSFRDGSINLVGKNYNDKLKKQTEFKLSLEEVEISH